MKKAALIMAGGRGERFWPKSREHYPKQFLSMTDDNKTMIQLTIERILPLVDPENIYIATNSDYKELVHQQLPDIPSSNILCEPVSRNTAPCIGLGAVNIIKKLDDAVMIVLPSDHLIKDTDIFRKSLMNACSIAESGENLVTLGITPTYPETGYGYICYRKNEMEDGAYLVERFVEKPDINTAKVYLKEGNYLWNSGMFVWKCSSILNNIKKLMPDLYTGLMKIKDAIDTPDEKRVLFKEFFNFRSESIDYGIMEKAEHIYTISGNFGWDDVGSWLAIARIQGVDESDNAIDGNVIAVDTDNCIIQGNKKLIATVGLEDVVIVDTEDVTLICTKERTGEIKKVLSELKQQGKDQYL